jgi:HlyD family secretion protein
MDVPRLFAAQARRRRQIVYAVAGMALIASITMGVSKLKPAAPSVDRLGLWIDTVKRGPMVRQVRGLGTLTPEEIRWIPTITDGRVEKILVRSGTPVKANTVVVILSNPTVEQQTFDAEWKLRAEEAQYHNLEVTLQSQVLDQKANTAKAEQDAEDARMKADTDEQLAKQGVIAKQASKLSTGSSRQLSIRAEIEQQRYENAQKALEAQLAAEERKLSRRGQCMPCNKSRKTCSR